MAKLTVLLDDDLMYAFKRQALEDRRSVSDVVRRFAEDYAKGVLAAGEVTSVAEVPANPAGVVPRVGESSAPAASTCRRKHLHHTNHRGNPCKECGWPT